MTTQGQIVSSNQASHRRMGEIFVVALAGAALAVGIAWAALANTSAKVDTLSRTTNGTLMEPGLQDQRAGERGVIVPQILEPGLQDQRAGERGGAVVLAPANGYPGGWTSTYSPIKPAAGGNDHALLQLPRGKRGQ
jgi:hypothetical protein